MKFRGHWFALNVLGCGLVLTGFSFAAGSGETIDPPSLKIFPMQFISAADPRFHYEGRFDFSDPTGLMVVWQGSRISLDFEGSQLALRFVGATEQNFFNVQVDGSASVVVGVPAGAVQRIVWPVLPGAGRHRLTLFKRSEAAAGQVRFAGVEIAPGAQAWTPAVPAYQLRMEFFGDSLMVGACNEDGATDQWDDRRTHNHALSYTTLTSAAFRAEHRCIAVSGMGIAAGYVDVKAGEVWDRLYPVANSPKADLKLWQPDVVCINFGENDDSFTRAQHAPFPAGYQPGYVVLVKAIRVAYPHAHLVLLRGGMYGGSQSQALREAWEAVVREVEAGDPAVSHYVFAHWSSNHPRVSDDRALAEELIAWLKRQAFMKPLLTSG